MSTTLTKNNPSSPSETIREGYKKTPIGVIPEDWEVKALNELKIKVKSGSNKGKKDTGKFKVFGSTGIIGYTDQYVYDEKLILCARVGANAGFIYDVDEKCDISDNTLILSNFKNLDQKFYQESLVQYNLNRLIFGSGQPLVTGSLLKQISLPIPPLPEQNAIADCLSTWDKGIEKLSALIASKKEQKKGLMQQLLTGKKRLDGFTEEWKEVRLREIIIVQGGYAFKSENFKNEGIPIIRISNLSAQSSQVEFNDIVYYEKISDKQFEINKGDMMIAMSGATTGKTAVYTFNEKAYLNQRVGLFRNKNEKKFCYSLLYSIVKTEYFENEIKKLLTTGAQPNISASDIESISINLPLLQEQTAIAEVLTTADKEIELLEQKLEAFKIQKKGLMQVLLTGEKRLV